MFQNPHVRVVDANRRSRGLVHECLQTQVIASRRRMAVTTCVECSSEDASTWSFSSCNCLVKMVSRCVLCPTGSSRVELTGSQFGRLLELLAEAPRPLSRWRLVERLFGREFDSPDRSNDVCVSSLRNYRGSGSCADDHQNPAWQGLHARISVASRGEVNRSSLL